MSDKDPRDERRNPGENPSINRRDILLSGTAALASIASGGATAQAQQAQPAPAPSPASGQKPNILDDHGRRHRLVQSEHLPSRHDGLPHAEHRPHRQRGRAVHRLVRRAELHGRTRRLHHRAVADPHRTDQGRAARRRHRPPAPKTRPSPNCSSRSATPPVSSARTISATRTNSCRPNHGFDEFFGNLYHLNAEEEPENPDYPKDPKFRRRFGPRGVIQLIRRRTDRGYRTAHQEADGDRR